MRSFFRVSISGLMSLILCCALCLTALDHPRVAVLTILLLMALIYLASFVLALAGAVILVRKLARTVTQFGGRATPGAKT